MEKIYGILTNIVILLLLILSFHFITYKYTKNLTNDNCIRSFKKKWKNTIHSMYSNTFYDEKSEILNTNYELNNGLFIDLQNKLRIPKI